MYRGSGRQDATSWLVGFLPRAEPLELPPSAWALAFDAAVAAGVAFPPGRPAK
jgi:hypothetical protein